MLKANADMSNLSSYVMFCIDNNKNSASAHGASGINSSRV